MNELMLWNPYDDSPSEASQAMTLAADYRAEGYDPSDALTEAWQVVKRGYEDDDEGAESNPDANLFGMLLIGGAIATLVFKQVKGAWWWNRLTPALGRGRIGQVRRVSQRPVPLARMRSQPTNRHDSTHEVLWPEFKNITLA